MQKCKRETEMEWLADGYYTLAWWLALINDEDEQQTVFSNITRNTLAIQPPGDEHVRCTDANNQFFHKAKKIMR